MSHSLGSGDVLARGAVRASYTVRDTKTISEDAWARMFEDFDPEEFKNKDTQKEAATGIKEVARTGR